MNLSHFRLTLTILSYYLATCVARGPHHPRGASIVKRHTHYTPGENAQKLTQDTELLRDREHIKEHLEEVLPKVDLSKMTDSEIELYYFLLHDTDKNSMLDGLELLNAVLHTTHEEDHDHGGDGEYAEEGSWENDTESHKDLTEEKFNHFVGLVDQVLKEDDKNQDGYLDYTEYVAGRKKAEHLVDKKPSINLP